MYYTDHNCGRLYSFDKKEVALLLETQDEQASEIDDTLDDAVDLEEKITGFEKGIEKFKTLLLEFKRSSTRHLLRIDESYQSKKQ